MASRGVSRAWRVSSEGAPYNTEKTAGPTPGTHSDGGVEGGVGGPLGDGRCWRVARGARASPSFTALCFPGQPPGLRLTGQG